MTEHDARRKALRHLIELETSGHSEAAWTRFETWLREDPAHRVAFSKLEKAWRTVGQLQTLLEGRDPAFDRPGSNSLARLSGREAPSWRERWWSIGAAVLLICAGSALARHYATEIAGRSSHGTDPLESRTISLEDDRTIFKNQSGRIEVTSTWLYREVRLDHDEAAAVSLHWPRSFLVCASAAGFRDIGIRFDVLRVGEKHVEAFVQRGSVASVTPTATAFSSAVGYLSATTERTIDAGQSATVESGEIMQQQLSADELERHVAWTEGVLVIDGSLADAVAELNRYNTRQLRIIDPVLLNTWVRGRYKTTDPDSFAKYLHKHGITSKRVRKGYLSGDLILIGARP
jgi:transmembrane sensor